MMFARFFKGSPFATVFALLLVLGLVACGSAQPTVEALHAQDSTALEMVGMAPISERLQGDAPVIASPDESIALDQYPESQALIARMAGVSTDTVLAMQSAGKMQMTALALCRSFRDDDAVDMVDQNQLYYAAGQIADIYSTEVADESRRVYDSLQHLNRLVDEACEADSRDKW